MDDFESGHDPASKPSDKNHTASPTVRRRAPSRRCGVTKSSNSERIRFTTDFAARRDEDATAVSQQYRSVSRVAATSSPRRRCGDAATDARIVRADRCILICQRCRAELRLPFATHDTRDLATNASTHVAERRRSPVKHARSRPSIGSHQHDRARAVRGRRAGRSILLHISCRSAVAHAARRELLRVCRRAPPRLLNDMRTRFPAREHRPADISTTIDSATRFIRSIVDTGA